MFVGAEFCRWLIPTSLIGHPHHHYQPHILPYAHANTPRANGQGKSSSMANLPSQAKALGINSPTDVMAARF